LRYLKNDKIISDREPTGLWQLLKLLVLCPPAISAGEEES